MTIGSFDGDGTSTGTQTISIAALPKDDLSAKAESIVKDYRDKAIVLSCKAVTVEQARQAVQDGKAGFDDHWALLETYLITSQQPEKAAVHQADGGSTASV